MKSKLKYICDLINSKISINEMINENLKSSYISTENMLPNKGGVTAPSSIPSEGKVTAYKKDDVLVSNIRPYFKKIWYAVNDGGCSNDVLVFRAKENISPDFLHYALADDAFFDYSMKTSKGTKMPRGDKAAIMEYEVTDMDYIMQRQSSIIPRLIDEKIAVNNTINENLEKQAQAIFKSWFVDFEPFGGNIPNNWEQGNLLEIADYLNGLAMQKFRPNANEIGLPVLKIKELRQGICDENSELCSPNIKPEYIIQDGDVIFSWSGSLLVDFWCGGTCGLNQHLFKVTSKKYDKWFYYSWTKYHLNRFIAIAADMATTMGHIKREELAKSIVLIPSKLDYQDVGSLLNPIYEMIITNRIENNRLSNLRDTLLPKLMNGEIDVSNIKI
ncbi:MAG: restriction endonuclease subunit S [Oscillospiraceae bacterium]|nr:restriction endonuclease subunit S [Oscillospiraceae bacterium]